MNDKERPSAHVWWVVWVSGMASYIDAAAIVGFGTSLVVYQRAFGLTSELVGVASAVLTLGIALGAVIGGRLGDVFGRRPVFTVTMMMIIAGGTVLTFTAEPALLVAAGLLLGLGCGADLPVSLSTIAEAADDTNRSRLIAFSQILWIVGILATVLLGVAFGNAGSFGAQVIFLHVSAVAAVVLLARLSIPESNAWLAARAGGGRGRPGQPVRSLLKPPYVLPFAALVVFYSLTNLAANTMGQFGIYLLVNVAGLDVSAASKVTLALIPLGLLGTIWFMTVADGPRRFAYFTVGGVLLVGGSLVPALLGLTGTTFVVSRVIALFGVGFAGEAIIKVWAQESFPTLLRTTAQGAVIAVARVVAAAFAGVTPLLVTAGVQMFFGILTVACLIGFGVAWLVFRQRVGHSEFSAFTSAAFTADRRVPADSADPP